MSDIGIRFDGLILLLGLVGAVVAYLIIAMIALMVAVVRSNKRAWKITIFAALLALGTFAIAAPFFVYWDRHGPAEWVDQLTYPWAVVFLGGCWLLARVR